MLSQVFKKLLVMGLPLTLLATVIGCSGQSGNVGSQVGSGGGGNTMGMVTPKINGNSYSVTLGAITSQAGAVKGSYVDGTCKSSVSGATQSGNWSWTADTDPVIAMVLNDTECQLNVASFKITGAGAGNYVAAVPMVVSSGAFNSKERFCNGDCSPTTSIYAKAKLTWVNGTVTISISYASDPTALDATGTGSYLTTSVINNTISPVLPPDYATFSNIAGAFKTDAAGYIQPPASSITGTFVIGGAGATQAQYYTIYSASEGGTLPGQDWRAPTYDPIYNDLFSNPATANTNGRWLYNAAGHDSITIPLYTADPTSTWALMAPITTAGHQPCGGPATDPPTDIPTSCNWTEGTTSISSTYKSFINYLVPTFIPATNLVYYVVMANVNETTKMPAFQVATITITLDP